MSMAVKRIHKGLQEVYFDDEPEPAGSFQEIYGELRPELTPQERAAFTRHVNGLNKLIEDLRRRVPEAQYYLACSLGASLNILSGPSHEGAAGEARQDRVIESRRLEHADGGDW